MKIRIKAGTPVFQDHRVFAWPGVYEEKINTTFDAEIVSSGSIVCRAFGFGVLKSAEQGAYGNGAIYISGKP